MALKLPKVPKSALGGSVQMGPPSGVGKPASTPMIDKRQNVGGSNVTKTRWSPPSAVRKMGNH